MRYLRKMKNKVWHLEVEMEIEKTQETQNSENSKNKGKYAGVCCETKAWMALVFLCSATFFQELC